jgi:hypothetical protein
MLRSKRSYSVLHSGKYPANEYLRHAKFIFEAWKHPQTLAIMSKIAGVELVPVMDYEIGHINISVPGQKRKDDNNVPSDEDDDDSVVGWHRDSYPFVCVLMMSDTTGMIGGETALRTGTGDIKKVRGPQRVRKISLI